MAEMLMLPTLERLPPYGDGALGLVFSVALKDGSNYANDPLRDWLKAFLTPWSWAETGSKFLPVAGLKVYYRSAGPWLEYPEDVPVTTTVPNGALKPGGIDALKARLRDRFRCFGEQTGDPWQWPLRKGYVDRAVRPWPAFLGEVALYPWPLPQALGLSFFFKLKNLPQDAELAVAPILRLENNGVSQSLVPASPVDSTLVPKAIELLYGEPVADLKITAVTVPVKLQDSPVGTFLDLKSLWVNKAGGDVTSEDWRSDLETRLAVELDLARLTLDWMKYQLEKDRAKVQAAHPKLTETVLSWLQDSTVPHLSAGVFQGDLLRRAAARRLDAQGKPFSESAVETLRTAAQPWFANVSAETWRAWVGEAMTGEGGPPKILTLKKEELGSLSVEETVAQLDQSLTALRSPAVAAALFQRAWADFLKTKNDDLAAALSKSLPKGEPGLALEALRAWVGEVWKASLEAVFGPGRTMEECRLELQKQIQAKLKEQNLPDDWSQTRVVETAERIFPKVSAPKGDQEKDARKKRVRGTRGITIEVDTLAADRDESDLLQRIQGVALLMRKKQTGDWHCLNLAEAKIGEQTISGRVLLPSRLAYVEGLSASTLTYDNQPLTSLGPLAKGDVAGTSIEGDVAGACLLDDPLVDFSYPRLPARIPELVFGREYEIVPFVVTNSGALPEALAEPSSAPWQLLSKITNPGAGAQSRPYTYAREARVGALRFEAPIELPSIPAQVAPRLRELPAETVLPPSDPLLRDRPSGTKTDSALAGTPLLLLAPPDFKGRPDVEVRKDFNFEIFPPTVDLQTWDRWVAASLDKSWRKFVWNTYYKLAYAKGNLKEEEKLEEAGVYLTDPAVSGFWAELVGFDSSGRGIDHEPMKISFDEAAFPPLADWQKEPETLRKFQKKPAQVSIGFGGSGLEVKVDGKAFKRKVSGDTQPLYMFRFSIYAQLKRVGIHRFQWPEAEPLQGHDDLTSPWHLLIEVPRPLPRTAELSSALRQALVPRNPPKDKMEVRIKMDGASLAALQGHVHRAEIWHQVWHWRGRPPAPHSEVASPPVADDKAVRFEMSEFGDRRDDEHRRLPMQRVSTAANPEFLYEENLVAQGPQGDFRALYHRFSARIFSRYEGLLREEESYLEAVDKDTDNRWNGLFVPCRHLGDVPAPKVKLVLPLTQGPDRDNEGPGLLVVIDGPWYEVGGLAEELGVEVMQVSGPEVKDGETDDKQRYYQIGTDPIVTAQSAGDVFNGKPGSALGIKEFEPNFLPVGAIGHHRDSSDVDPHFLASSFLLPRPTISKAGSQIPRDLSWWFMKLRFQRKLQLEGGVVRQSDWSAPFWVQLLPGVERVEEEWFEGREPEIVLRSGNQLSVNWSIKRATEKAGSRFYFFGLMTRRVVDFAGRPDQEAYLGVWWWDGSAWKTDLKIESKKDLYIRWMEIQSSQKIDVDKDLGSQDFWARLFEPDLPDSKRARIVRISRPFCVKGAS